MFFLEALETRRDEAHEYSRAQKGTGPRPEISRDKAFNPRLRKAGSLRAFLDDRRTDRRLYQMSPKHQEILEQVHVRLDAWLDTYIFSRHLASATQILWRPLENLGRASSISESAPKGSARVRNQKGKHFIPTWG